MQNDTGCSVRGCSKPTKRRGYCYGHYMKAWRYGTPEPTFDPRWPDLAGQRFGMLVVVERQGTMWCCTCDCGGSTLVRAGDLNRGNVASCGDRAVHQRRDDIGYPAAHERVRADRGLVQTHSCVDCGRPAQHWSYNHTDEAERLATGLSKNPIAYSVDPLHYSPRCVRCHKRFDLARADGTKFHSAYQ